MPQRSSKKSPKAAYANSGESATNSAGKRERLGLILIASSIFLILCLITFDPGDPSFNGATSGQEVNNICGLFGSHLSDAFVQVLGLTSFLIPPALLVFGINLFFAGRKPMVWSRAGCFLLLLALCSSLLARLDNPAILNFPPDQPGGAVGELLGSSLTALMGNAGAILVTATMISICGAHVFNIGLRSAFTRLSHGLKNLIIAMKTALAKRRTVKPVKILDEPVDSDTPPSTPVRKPLILERKSPHLRSNAPAPEPAIPLDLVYDWREDLDSPSWERLSWLPDDVEIDPLPLATGRLPADEPQKALSHTHSAQARAPEPNIIPPNNGEKSWSPELKKSGLTYEQMKRAIDEYLAERARLKHGGNNTEVPNNGAPQKPSEPQSANVAEKKPFGENRVQASPEAAPTAQLRPIEVSHRADEDRPGPTVGNSWGTGTGDYILPPLDLLDEPDLDNRSVDKQELEVNALVLEKKLEDLGIKGEVVAIHPGPVITMYELSLGAKIPLRKVLNKADDLAMALKSGSTRVVAPIPGKDTVGIEVPNLNRETVYFREIVQANAFQGLKDPLKMALGKGIDGEPFCTSLARMPHLLIAGATGTGKSVGLNSMILSWLMSCHPDDVKFLMVDPKKLELSYYQDIPHLIHPVVTEPEKVPKVLSWAIREMDRRYELLSKAGAKSISGYNDLVAKAEARAPECEGPEKLPYIVIIVDELAELMMVAAKDIEISIARLAQMARAAGIHLILATQRPSVDVITGVIKANFPARLSFQVSAKADSRTILDTVGAEALLGKGDLLFVPPGTAKLMRLHGAFVSENEIRNIVDHIKAQRGPVYLEEISKHVSESSTSEASSGPCEDEKYDAAVELVTRLGNASISLIQRHMRIGYNRAARIIEAMESEGIIGPSDGTSRPREVLAGSLDHIPEGPS